MTRYADSINAVARGRAAVRKRARPNPPARAPSPEEALLREGLGTLIVSHDGKDLLADRRFLRPKPQDPRPKTQGPRPMRKASAQKLVNELSAIDARCKASTPSATRSGRSSFPRPRPPEAGCRCLAIGTWCWWITSSTRARASRETWPSRRRPLNASRSRWPERESRPAGGTYYGPHRLPLHA